MTKLRPALLLPAAAGALLTAFVDPFYLIKSVGLYPTALLLVAAETAFHAIFTAAYDERLRGALGRVFLLLASGPALGLLAGPMAPFVGAALFVVFALGLPALERSDGAMSLALRRARARPLSVVVPLVLLVVVPLVVTWLTHMVLRSYPGHIPAPVNLGTIWLVAFARYAIIHFAVLAPALRRP